MLLRDIVRTSQQITQSKGRLAKVTRLSACLRNLGEEEIHIGVNFLAGRLRQGGIGVGAAVLHAAAPDTAASEPSLTLMEVDRAFDTLVRMTGSGSGAERRHLLGTLLSRATPDEQQFLKRLVLGEVRQGALEGLMVEAIARAADVPASDVRRAVMLADDLPQVAAAALRDGRAGLSRFSLQVLHPIQPMLAQSADDVADVLDRLHEAAFEYKMDGARVQVHKLGEDQIIGRHVALRAVPGPKTDPHLVARLGYGEHPGLQVDTVAEYASQAGCQPVVTALDAIHVPTTRHIGG